MGLRILAYVLNGRCILIDICDMDFGWREAKNISSINKEDRQVPVLFMC
jgi:hypothetical protein